jgi:hypothetical protein
LIHLTHQRLTLTHKYPLLKSRITLPYLSPKPNLCLYTTPTAIFTSPSQNSSSGPNPSGAQTGLFLGLDWIQIIVISLLTAIAILLFVNILLLRKKEG